MSSFVEHFRRNAEAFLAAHPRVRHVWSTEGDFTFLEILNEDPLGFSVRANVSSRYTLILADGNVDRKFEPSQRPDLEDEAFRLAEFVVSMLTPRVRLREIKRGNRTLRWLLEEQGTDGWTLVASRYSFNPLSYFGRRHESIRQNRLIRGQLSNRGHTQQAAED